MLFTTTGCMVKKGTYQKFKNPTIPLIARNEYKKKQYFTDKYIYPHTDFQYFVRFYNKSLFGCKTRDKYSSNFRYSNTNTIVYYFKKSNTNL